MMARVKSGNFDRARFGIALWDGLNSKNILLHFNDVQAQRGLQTANWGGGVTPGEGDFLMVLDSNVGFNKLNAIMAERISYEVKLSTQGNSTATATIDYHNPAHPVPVPCDHRAYYGKNYDDLEQRCYWDVVRVLAPAGSILTRADGIDDAAKVEEIESVTAFQGYFVLKRGESNQAQFEYALPAPVVKGNRYELKIQKQPGAPPLPVHVRVQLPSTWEARASNYAPNPGLGGTIDFDLQLDHDQTIVIDLNKTRSFPWLLLALGGILLISGGAAFWFSSRNSKSKG